jgi:hypothetical protein
MSEVPLYTGLYPQNAAMRERRTPSLNAQGYHAHKKLPPPLGTPQGPTQAPYCGPMGLLFLMSEVILCIRPLRG